MTAAVDARDRKPGAVARPRPGRGPARARSSRRHGPDVRVQPHAEVGRGAPRRARRRREGAVGGARAATTRCRRVAAPIAVTGALDRVLGVERLRRPGAVPLRLVPARRDGPRPCAWVRRRRGVPSVSERGARRPGAAGPPSRATRPPRLPADQRHRPAGLRRRCRRTSSPAVARPARAGRGSTPRPQARASCPSRTRNRRSGALRPPRPRASPARRRRPRRHPGERAPAGRWRRRAPRRLEPERAASPTPVSRLRTVPDGGAASLGMDPEPMIRARWRWRHWTTGRAARRRTPTGTGLGADVDFVREHLLGDPLVERIGDAEVVVVMRERTPFDADLLARLPGLRLLGHDRRRERLDRRGGGAGPGRHGLRHPAACPGPAAELTWALILRAAAPGAARGRDGPGRRLAGHRRRRPGGRDARPGRARSAGHAGSRGSGWPSGWRCWPGRRTSTQPWPASRASSRCPRTSSSRVRTWSPCTCG